MNLAFVEAVRKYIGLKWVHQGRSRTQGVDCLGLVVLAARDIGMEVEDCTSYRRRPDDQKLLSKVNDHFTAMPAGTELEPGDVLLIHFKDRNKSPYHFAVVDKDPRYIIHGYAPHRRVIVDLVESWLENIHSVYRIPETL